MQSRLKPHAFSHRRRRRGLGLVELLICLSISSMILTATGAAFYGSFNSYRETMARGQMNAMGRSALTTIMRDVRMSDTHGPWDQNATMLQTETNSQFGMGQMPGNPTPGLPSAGGSGALGIQMVKTHSDSQDPNAGEQQYQMTITYWYDSATRRLMTARQQSQTVTVASTLAAGTCICEGVQSCRFYLQPMYIPYNPQRPSEQPAWGLQQVVVVLTLANSDANGNLVYDGGRNVTLTLTNAATPRRNFMTR